MALPAKRKRILVTASIKGIDRAEKALARLGFDTKYEFAKAQFMSKSTVDKFFNRQPIQPDSFKRICEGLKIDDWRSVAELGPIVESIQPESVQPLTEREPVEAIATQRGDAKPCTSRQYTVVDRQTQEILVEVILEGNIDSIEANAQGIFEMLLKQHVGQTIKVRDIREGSIRVTVEGSPEDITKLMNQINSGELTEINGFPVEDIQIVSPDFPSKWDLVQEIIGNPIAKYQLAGQDLSDTDLSGVDLSEAGLSEADLSGADLSEADLSEADLSGADLSGADLSGADLSEADLSGADLTNKLLFVRARARHLDRALLRHLDRALLRDRVLDSARRLDCQLAHDLDLTLDRERARALALDRCRARYLALALDRIINLSDSKLSAANFSGAIVEATQFGEGLGLTEAEKENLKWRGAIFQDAPGDRESNKLPSPSR